MTGKQDFTLTVWSPSWEAEECTVLYNDAWELCHYYHANETKHHKIEMFLYQLLLSAATFSALYYVTEHPKSHIPSFSMYQLLSLYSSFSVLLSREVWNMEETQITQILKRKNQPQKSKTKPKSTSNPYSPGPDAP